MKKVCKAFTMIFAVAILTTACESPASKRNTARLNEKIKQLEARVAECENGADTTKSSTGSTTTKYKTPVQSRNPTEKDPYEMMEVAFEGSPEISEIKPMMEAVIEKYGLPKTDEYRRKVGSMLVSLRKASAVGVTEMEILKHIYQKGSTEISLPDQAGLSATLLELNK